MTREEREKALEVWYDITFDDKRFDEARKISIEALKVEPCEDAISREKTCDYIAEFINHEYSTQSECEMVEAMIDGIQHLPPVNPLSKDYNTIYYTPQTKTGHWKHNKCDVCGASRPPLFDNYCPNCGAKMIEPQESEE